jgi:hypothetical protein
MFGRMVRGRHNRGRRGSVGGRFAHLQQSQRDSMGERIRGRVVALHTFNIATSHHRTYLFVIRHCHRMVSRVHYHGMWHDIALLRVIPQIRARGVFSLTPTDPPPSLQTRDREGFVQSLLPALPPSPSANREPLPSPKCEWRDTFSSDASCRYPPPSLQGGGVCHSGSLYSNCI